MPPLECVISGTVTADTARLVVTALLVQIAEDAVRAFERDLVAAGEDVTAIDPDVVVACVRDALADVQQDVMRGLSS